MSPIRYTAMEFVTILALMVFFVGGGREAPDPVPAEPAFGDVRLSTGVRLHYAEQGPAEGRAVILLHGWSDSWFSWSRVLPLMPEAWHVFALDQRGHGDSDRPDGGYAMDAMARDVIAFMEARGLRTATIAGHSMGSLIAQHVAAIAPSRVSALVLVDAAPQIRFFPGMADMAGILDTLPDPVPLRFIREFQESTVYAPVPEAFMDRVVAESRKLPIQVWRRVATGMQETPEAAGLGGLGIPVLILWGEQDGVFSRGAQDALLKLVPEAEFVAYPETGHAPHWERPDEVARDIRTFVDR